MNQKNPHPADGHEQRDQLFDKVADFGSEAIEKVKDIFTDDQYDKYTDIPAVKMALKAEFEKIKKTADQADIRLNVLVVDKDHLKELNKDLSKELKDHQSCISGLFGRIKDLRKEEQAKDEAQKNEASKAESTESEEELLSETAHVSKAAEDEVPYDTQHYPRSVYDRREHGAADYEKASRVAPDNANNTVVLETDSENDHLEQSWPEPMG